MSIGTGRWQPGVSVGTGVLVCVGVLVGIAAIVAVSSAVAEGVASTGIVGVDVAARVDGVSVGRVPPREDTDDLTANTASSLSLEALTRGCSDGSMSASSDFSIEGVVWTNGLPPVAPWISCSKVAPTLISEIVRPVVNGSAAKTR